MADKRIEILLTISKLTESGKLNWKIGTKTGQYIAHIPGGTSFVIMKFAKDILENISDRQLERLNRHGRSVDGNVYVLQVRDKLAAVIEEIRSSVFEEEQGVLGEIPTILMVLTRTIEDHIDRQRNIQLDTILKDLNSL